MKRQSKGSCARILSSACGRCDMPESQALRKPFYQTSNLDYRIQVVSRAYAVPLRSVWNGVRLCRWWFFDKLSHTLARSIRLVSCWISPERASVPEGQCHSQPHGDPSAWPHRASCRCPPLALISLL